MTDADWYLLVSAALVSVGTIRMLTAQDPIIRLVALNVAGAGSLMALVALATRTRPADPVLHALALTGIVITVAMTAVGLALVRRIEDGGEDG